MSIMEYNGGSVLAMKGKDSVAIVSDKYFGANMHAKTSKFERIFQFGPRLFVGLPGLGTDTMTVARRLRFRTNMYELRENRRISPRTMTSLISNFFYERRFGPYFIDPIVAGIDDKTHEPFIAGMDLLGCVCDFDNNFLVSGSCSDELFGMCESLWEPDMTADELCEAAAQSMINATARNASSGWGALVYLVEKDCVTIKDIKTRMD